MGWPTPDTPLNQTDTTLREVVAYLNEYANVPPSAKSVALNPPNGPVYDWGGELYNVKSAQNPAGPAKGDAHEVNDGAITTGLKVLTSASNPFVVGDVGKPIYVTGAGAAAAQLGTTIASFQSAGQVTLTAAAGTTVTGANVLWGTDDTASIQAAITAAGLVAGYAVMPAVKVGYLCLSTLTISSMCWLAGQGIAALWPSVGASGFLNNMPCRRPYLKGTVLIMPTPATDILQVTVQGEAANLNDFGMRFSDGIKFSNTGHGINQIPATYLTYHDNGMFFYRWRNIHVYGHDGNHYAYKLMNSIIGLCEGINFYGGGGLQFIQDSASYIYGNTIFTNFVGSTVVAGTAHNCSLEKTAASGTNKLAFLRFIRPGTYVGSQTGITPAPTSAQKLLNLSNIADVKECLFDSPDYETNVGSGATFPSTGSNLVTGGEIAFQQNLAPDGPTSGTIYRNLEGGTIFYMITVTLNPTGAAAADAIAEISTASNLAGSVVVANAHSPINGPVGQVVTLTFWVPPDYYFRYTQNAQAVASVSYHQRVVT